MPKNAKNAILWTLFVTPLAQRGKLDQTDAFSYYVGVGSTQQRLVPELMVSFLLPQHINLSNNATNRSGAKGTNPRLRINGQISSVHESRDKSYVGQHSRTS